MGWETDKQVTPCGSVMVGLPCYLALGRYSRCAATVAQMATLLCYQAKALPTTAQRAFRSFYVLQLAYLHGNVLSGQL
jgi:hypothetical protein